MTDIVLSATLWLAVTEILEKMFFIDTSDVQASGIQSVRHEDDVSFEGDPPGWLQLRLSAEAACSLAADFLGEDRSGLSPQKTEEVVCELASMTCGSFLSRLESRSDFRLAAPEILNAPTTTTAQPPMACRTVPLARGFLTVGMTMEGKACAVTEEYGS